MNGFARGDESVAGTAKVLRSRLSDRLWFGRLDAQGVAVVLEIHPPFLEMLCVKVGRTGCEDVMFAVSQITKVGG